MSEGTPLYRIPVIKRPLPLEFRVRGQGENPPSVVCGCGHRQWRVEEFLVEDRVVRTSKSNFSIAFGRLPGFLQKFNRPELCFRCRFAEQLEAAIQCFQCGDVIFRGDPVCTLMPVKVTEEEQARGVLTPNGYVGCMRWECCPSGLFFAGHWAGDGVLTKYQSGNLANAAFSGEVGGEDGIIVENFGPLKE